MLAHLKSRAAPESNKGLLQVIGLTGTVIEILDFHGKCVVKAMAKTYHSSKGVFHQISFQWSRKGFAVLSPKIGSFCPGFNGANLTHQAGTELVATVDLATLEGQVPALQGGEYPAKHG